MNTETTTPAPPTDEVILAIRKIKEENAAKYGFDIEAIAAAARDRQNSSGREVVRRANGRE